LNLPAIFRNLPPSKLDSSAAQTLKPMAGTPRSAGVRPSCCQNCCRNGYTGWPPSGGLNTNRPVRGVHGA